jgi:hypothetical protein
LTQLSLLIMSIETCRELKIEINTYKGICASHWSFIKNHYMMHGQQNITATSVFMYVCMYVYIYIYIYIYKMPESFYDPKLSVQISIF